MQGRDLWGTRMVLNAEWEPIACGLVVPQGPKAGGHLKQGKF